MLWVKIILHKMLQSRTPSVCYNLRLCGTIELIYKISVGMVNKNISNDLLSFITLFIKIC